MSAGGKAGAQGPLVRSGLPLSPASSRSLPVLGGGGAGDTLGAVLGSGEPFLPDPQAQLGEGGTPVATPLPSVVGAPQGNGTLRAFLGPWPQPISGVARLACGWVPGRCVCLAAEGFSQRFPDGDRECPRARGVSRARALDERWGAGPAFPMGLQGRVTGRGEGAT